MKKKIHLWIILFIFASIVIQGKTVWAQESSHMANVILFVSFSDTAADYWEGAGGEINRIYNETMPYNALSVKDYFAMASCGKLELDNIMPQMSKTVSDYVILPITLDSPTETYGSAGNDYKLLRDAIQKLSQDNTLLDNLNGELDYDGDGYIDNVTFLVASAETERSSTLYPHKADGAQYSLSIKGLSMNHYNVINYGRLGSVSGGAGVAAHEFLHVLGPLDTYVVCDSDTGNCDAGPVGCWDIMADTCPFVQYPLAYTRKELGWIDIEEVSVSGTYTLTSPQKDSNQYSMILKTPYSDTEFFVVEYRKQGSFYNTELENKIDAKIGGSGIIIYRVNMEAAAKSNLVSNYIYLFRQGESEEQATKTGARQSGFFSEEAGRTTFGSNDSRADSADGAITYTDGTNSGIVIKNVGSAEGDTITFDVEYTIDMSGESWEKENFSFVSGNYGSGLDAVLQNSQLFASNIQIVSFGGELYGLHSNSEGNAELLHYVNGLWQCVQILAQNSYGMDFKVGTDGYIYIVCEQNYSTIKVYRMNEREIISDISGNMTLQGSVANPKLAITSEGLVMAYRDYKNGDTIHVYQQKENSWQDLEVNGAAGNAFALYGRNNKVYLAVGQGQNNCIYQCNLSESRTFVKYGNDFSVNRASCVDLAVDDKGVVYIAYYDTVQKTVQVKGYQQNEWIQLGMNVYNQMTTDVKILIEKGTVYVAYQGENSTGIKSHSIFSGTGVVTEDDTIGYEKKGVEVAAEEKVAKNIETTSLPKTSFIGMKVTNAGLEYVVTGVQAGKATVECTKLTNKKQKKITIPATITVDGITYKVTSVAKNAFRNNKSLTKVTIGSNVTTIRSGAFSGCKKLKNITMGKNVATIGAKAFYKCSALTKIVIPAKVKKIGKQTFYGCKKLKSITVKTTKLSSKTVGKKAFSGTSSKAVVKVPKSRIKAYRKLLIARGIYKKAKIKK